MTSACLPPLSPLQLRSLEDPYYAPLTRAGADDETLLSAGFFADSLGSRIEKHPCWDLSMRTTPLGKLTANLADLPAVCASKLVLLCTGSFSPVHQGHLHLMQVAKDALQERGHHVIGGFLSPSHDEYVSVKRGGQAALHIEHRIALLEEAVADSDWLSVCPWEGRYAPVALNFTDVLARLQAYLRLNVAPDIEVVYVFGSDNAEFYKAFLYDGFAVCVERESALSSTGKARARCFWPADARLLFVESKNPHMALASSSAVRQGRVDYVPHATQHRAARLFKGSVQSPGEGTRAPATVTKKYLLRNDLAHATSHWTDVACPEKLETATVSFLGRICEILRDAVAAEAELQVLDLVAQQNLAARWEAQGDNLVSLDPCLNTRHSLAISRLFEASSGQVRAHCFTNRPGSASIAQQVLALKRSGVTDFVCVDDDKATGSTQRQVETHFSLCGLRPPVFRFLNEYCINSSEAVEDIVDARDFLLGARDGGLVVGLPGSGLAGRAPYMLPFTNLVFRAKIKPEVLMQVSRALWQCNLDFFEHVPLKVGQADIGARRFLRSLGWHDDALLAQFARKQLSYLEASANR